MDQAAVETSSPEQAAAAGAAQADAPSADPDALLAQANDRFLRAKAEHENYRKRMQRELSEVRDQMKLLTIQEFLPVFDHFRMAVTHAEETADSHALKQGMDMIQSELERTLESLGVRPIPTRGAPFDPNLHDAVAQEHSDTVPEGHVLREWKNGFCLGDKLLRPAAVVVSSGPAPNNGETNDNE